MSAKHRAIACILFLGLGFVGLSFAPAAQAPRVPSQSARPQFAQVQPQTVGVSGGQPNCWADFNDDGWLDLFVGMNGKSPNKLYLGSAGGTFKDVAADVSVADAIDTRGLGCGDFDGDGHIDLYVAFTKRSGAANKLYRNEGHGKRFSEV